MYLHHMQRYSLKICNSSVVEHPDCNHEVVVVYASEHSYFFPYFCSKSPSILSQYIHIHYFLLKQSLVLNLTVSCPVQLLRKRDCVFTDELLLNNFLSLFEGTSGTGAEECGKVQKILESYKKKRGKGRGTSQGNVSLKQRGLEKYAASYISIDSFFIALTKNPYKQEKLPACLSVKHYILEGKLSYLLQSKISKSEDISGNSQFFVHWCIYFLGDYLCSV